MRKSSAFTLAEVLITLGIIGVVAAMTIPNLIANTNGAKYRSGFKKAIATLNQAGLMAQAQYDFDFAGATSVEATSGSCASDHPESDMTFCSILNGTLTGHTYLGKVSTIKRQSNSSGGAATASYIINTNGASGALADYQSYYAYSLADGSIIGIHPSSSNCTLNIGESLNDKLSAGAPWCTGFIDVNGVTLPNKEVRCSEGNTTSAVNESCFVKNNANDMTDVFPIYFHDSTVEPASNAAKYVLSTSK